MGLYVFTTATDDASFLLAELRHHPEEIRALFRNGTNPYKTKIRQARRARP